MDRFLSHFTHRFDAKGRISIPAAFRQALARDGFEGVYVHPSLDQPALDCGGNRLLAEIDQLLASLPPFSPTRDAFATALLGTSEILRMDSEGRVMLDDRLKASLGLEHEAVFVGQGHKFQIWEPSRFAAHLEAARARVRRLRAGEGREAGAVTEALRHVPVLLAEVLEALAPRPGGLIIDGTFGAGGYTRALLDRGAEVIALDRDPSAVRAGAGLAAESDGRLRLVEARFGELDPVARDLGLDAVDGVVLDIGVSSMQLDEAERGFSLRFDAPLDMRMEGKGPSAADILRDADEETIADILFHFGEERASRRIARAIVADRETRPYERTLPLAEMIARVVPAKRGELTHPATRTFQALRIAVNDELGELLRGLVAAERLLKPGGRLAVVTFHSLEDRIVKQFLAGRSGRGHAASRRLPGEPAEPAPTSMFRAASRSRREMRRYRPTRGRARPSSAMRRGSTRRRGMRGIHSWL